MVPRRIGKADRDDAACMPAVPSRAHAGFDVRIFSKGEFP
jgi:hypothetical protein